MRRGNHNYGGNGGSLDAEPVTPQAKPDFPLTIEELLSDDFDPTALRAFLGEERCKNITRLLAEAGVSIPNVAQIRARRQPPISPISKTA